MRLLKDLVKLPFNIIIKFTFKSSYTLLELHFNSQQILMTSSFFHIFPHANPLGSGRREVSDLLGSFERTLKETAPPPPQASLLSTLLALPSLGAETATAMSAPLAEEKPREARADEVEKKPKSDWEW